MNENLQKKTVTVIIATKNRYSDIFLTIKSLEGVDVSGFFRPEIFVIDNGSTDKTCELISLKRVGGFDFRYLFHENPGKSSALNAAIQLIDSDVLVFTDDDLRFSPSWLENLTRPIYLGESDASQGKIVLAPDLRRSWMSELHRSALAETVWVSETNPESLIGANMAIHKRVLAKVPAFDEDLGPAKTGNAEDTFFSLQLLEAGFKFAFCSDACVEHHFDVRRLSKKSFVNRAYAGGYSFAYIDYHWKHLDMNKKNMKFVYLKMIYRKIKNKKALFCRDIISDEDFYFIMDKGYHDFYEKFGKSVRNYDFKGLIKKIKA